MDAGTSALQMLGPKTIGYSVYIYMYNAFNALEVHYSTRSRGGREGRGGTGGEGESGERRERRGGGSCDSKATKLINDPCARPQTAYPPPHPPPPQPPTEVVSFRLCACACVRSAVEIHFARGLRHFSFPFGGAPNFLFPFPFPKLPIEL